MKPNKVHKIWILTVLISPLLYLISCGGEQQSLHKLLFVTSDDENRTDVLIEKARLDFDSGNYYSAQEKTEKILSSDPEHRAAILLKANSELAMAELSLLDIITRVIDDTTSSTSSTTSDTADTLNNLSSLVLNLTTSDYEALGTMSTLNNNSILGEIGVITPTDPGDFETPGTPRHDLNSLRLINQAIKTVCPLISTEVLTSLPSNSRYNCAAAANQGSVQASFIFFTGHFVEALIFNSVLLYSDSDNNASSLQLLTDSAEANSAIFKQITALENGSSQTQDSFDALTDLTEAISEVTKNVQSIFDTSDGSMLSSLMVNLRTAVDVIGAIDGVPDDFTKSLTSALDNIEETAAKAGESTNSVSSETSALKQKLSGQIVQKLNTQMKTFFSKVDTLKAESGGDLSECQKAKVKNMCSQSSSIVADFDSIATPDGCNEYSSVDTDNVDTENCTD